MTEVMVRQALALSPPSSRQDIVSALLNDYGNSFGHDDMSPTTYSPVPPQKDLPPPPPPPRADSLRNKPLPAVHRMSMKFQLRVDEEPPLSPNGTRKESLEQQPRRRIISSRSLSREAKPSSLKLLKSNGSTATVPPTPPLPVPPKTLPSSEKFEDKDLPPPPPEKSVRRKSVKQPAMGNSASKAEKELARNDSLLSQGEPKGSADVASDVAPAVKRKALPVPGLKKFTSLAELGKGPRGGKGGPMPPASAPRKGSVDDGQRPQSTLSNASQSTDKAVRPQQEQLPRNAPAVNQLPPTPDEDKSMVAPAPPRKAFTGMGLPSNPRAKAPPSPLHVRGKSSTGFNLLKTQKAAPQVVETITPEMTPSPKPKLDEEKKDTNISPASPLPQPSNQYRPFSFEALPARQPQPPAQQPRPSTASASQSTAAAAPPPKSQAPPRRSSLDRPPLKNNTRPTQQPGPRSPPFEPSPSIPEDAPSPPPFAPLTRQPIPLPVRSIPAISPSHLHCYTSHSTSIWSNNTFQPMGCMVCHDNSRERKWACTWCQLRICRACSMELVRIPGRKLGILLEGRERAGNGGMRKMELGGRPGIVVEDVDGEVRGEYEDRFRGRF